MGHHLIHFYDGMSRSALNATVDSALRALGVSDHKVTAAVEALQQAAWDDVPSLLRSYGFDVRDVDRSRGCSRSSDDQD